LAPLLGPVVKVTADAMKTNFVEMCYLALATAGFVGLAAAVNAL
jgi:hypothetical protein